MLAAHFKPFASLRPCTSADGGPVEGPSEEYREQLMPAATPPRANLQVRVQPRAPRNEVVGYRGDQLRLRVTAPPEGGRANEAVIVLLSQALGIAKRRVSILRGHASRDKLVRVDGMEDGEVQRRLKL